MNIKTASFILFCLVLFSCSCTLEKRHYSGGYYVDWSSGRPPLHNANSTALTGKKPVDAEAPSITTCTDADEQIETIPQSFSVVKKHSQTVLSKAIKLPASILRKQIIAADKGTSYHSNKHTSAEDNGKILNGWALASALTIVFLITIIFILAVAAPDVGGAFVLALVISFMLFAIISGIYAISQFTRNPGKYWGLGFAIFGLTFSLSLILLILLALVLEG